MSERPIMIAHRGGLAAAHAHTPAKPVLADLLAHFWHLDRERPFTAPETRLYCYWLNQFHAVGWPGLLLGREQLVAAHLNMSVQVLTRACAGLVSRGLLDYEAGTAGQVATWGLPAHWAGLTVSLPTPPHR